MNTPLHCYIFPDLLPWERAALESLVFVLSKLCPLKIIDVSGHDPLVFPETGGAIHWVLSKNWKKAARKVWNVPSPKIYFSVLSSHSEPSSLQTLFLDHFRKGHSSRIHLITHSPLSFRFYREMERFSCDQVTELPLPMPGPEMVRPQERVGNAKEVTVGIFAPFTSESNLNFTMNIAHYLSRRRSNVRFRILGSGPLYSHVSRMALELGLHGLSVTEVVTSDAMRCLDIFLYTPLRNVHFLPVLLAAQSKIPLLVSDLPGMEEYVTDAHSGFIVPHNETKPIAELVLRLVDQGFLRHALAQESYRSLSRKFSLENVAKKFIDFFDGKNSR